MASSVIPLYLFQSKWLENDPNLLEKYIRLLSEAEYARVMRFVKMEDRCRSIGSIFLQKTVLAQLTGVDQSNILFQKNKYGKPMLQKGVSKQLICYNVSHDSDFVVLGYSRKYLFGIDIMDISNVIEVKELRGSFSDWEWNWLHGGTFSLLKSFYLLWCLKESYIKAVGLGLSIEPHRISFVLTPNKTWIGSLDKKALEGWIFRTFVVTENIIGAFAKGPIEQSIDFEFYNLLSTVDECIQGNIEWWQWDFSCTQFIRQKSFRDE